MPHLIYLKTPPLEVAARRFAPCQAVTNGWRVKLTQCYIASNGRALLVDAVAVRSGFSQHFYLLAELKGERLTLRVDPHTNVEKNEGVKRTLLLLRDWLLDGWTGAELEKTNLEADLLAESPSPREAL